MPRPVDPSYLETQQGDSATAAAAAVGLQAALASFEKVWTPQTSFDAEKDRQDLISAQLQLVDSGRGQLADALSASFDMHLKGLLYVFQVVKQQNVELLQEMQKPEVWQDTFGSLRAQVNEGSNESLKTPDASLAETSTKETPLTQSSTPQQQEQQPQSVKDDEGFRTASATPEPTGRASVQKEGIRTPQRRTLTNNKAEDQAALTRAQFDRLRGNLDVLQSRYIFDELLEAYGHTMEIESVSALILWLTGVDIGDDSASEPRSPGERRTSNAFSGSLMDPAPALKDAEIDFEAFRKLRQGDLEDCTNAVRRDVMRLRDLLRMEELHALYQDDCRPQLGEVDHGKSRKIRQKVDWFLEYVPPFVICLNSLVIGISAQLPDLSDLWQVCEVLFMLFYSLEFGLKISFLGCRGFWLGPEWHWNTFDAACLLTTVVDFVVVYSIELFGEPGENSDVSDFALIKIFRLSRLARLARTLRYQIFRELNLMVQGVLSGFRTLIWAIVLLLVLIFVVGTAMMSLIGDREEEFKSLDGSMFTLFRCFTDGCTTANGAPLAERLRRTYGGPFLLAYSFIYLLVTVGIFNLIMAMIIDNVVVSQGERKQQELSNSAQKTEVALKEDLCRLLLQSKNNGVPEEVEQEIRSLEDSFKSKAARVRAQFDCLADAQIEIGVDAFHIWLEDQHFCSTLETADIDIHNKSRLFQVMDSDMGGTLNPHEVFHGLMMLRGPVSKNDIIGMNLKVKEVLRLLQRMYESD